MPYNPLQFNPETFAQDTANAAANMLPMGAHSAVQFLVDYAARTPKSEPNLPEAKKLNLPFSKNLVQLGGKTSDYAIATNWAKGRVGLAQNYFLPEATRQSNPTFGSLHEAPLHKSVISSNANPTYLAHEMGHALDYATPQGKKAMRYQIDPDLVMQYENSFRGLGEPEITYKNLKMSMPIGVRQLGHASMVTPNVPDNPASMIATGALTNLLDPLVANNLRSEAVAHMYGKKLADEAGIKYNKRLAGGSYMTYPLTHIGRGAKAGLQSWLMSQVADKGMKAARDYVIDPVSSMVNPELTELEKSLEPYGYNREDYRFQGDPVGADDALINRTLDRPLPIKIEPRFGRR